MLQHGDLFAHLSVAAPTVPRVGFAADGELRDSCACLGAEYVWPCVFLLSPTPLLERMCVRDLGVATDLSVLCQMIRHLGSSLRPLQALNKIIPSSFQGHPGSTCEVMSSNCSLGSCLFSKPNTLLTRVYADGVTAVCDCGLLVVDVDNGVWVQRVRGA